MTENLAGRGEGLAVRDTIATLKNLYDTRGLSGAELLALQEAIAALEAAAPPSTPSKSFYDHVAPDRAAIEKNKAEEPHGERLRAELEDWLDRNGIVSMRLDTQNHCVSVDIAKLPPEIKSVLRLWGSIYVERAALATPSPQAPKWGAEIAARAEFGDLSPTSAREQSSATASNEPSVGGEVAWLIERGGLCLGFCEYKFAWVTFTNENALRFSRKIDAYSFKETIKWEPKWAHRLDDSVITEHQWG